MIEYINKLRTSLAIPEQLIEIEKGIKSQEGFFWAFPDGKNKLSNNTYLYFEIEKGQNHPDTNVLKYWPVLEENHELKIILVQWIIKKPRSKNRWELSKFVGAKMENILAGRFNYCFLEYDEETNINKLESLKTLLIEYKN
jgi:hypothetical protein